jgi:Tol biopolymer transport system component
MAKRGAALILLALLAISGCGRPEAAISLQPAPEERDRTDLGLGPGVRPLTTGPGDKSSPSFSPDGKRLAFVIDGYAAVSPVGSQGYWTKVPVEISAARVSWTSPGGRMIISGEELLSGEEYPVHLFPGDDRPREPVRAAEEVLAAVPVPRDGGLLVAVEGKGSRSVLALLNPDGKSGRVYPEIDGRITNLSPTPDGDRAIAVTQGEEPDSPAALHYVNLSDGSSTRLVRLKSGMQVSGLPQWTKEGIYFVATEGVSSEEKDLRYRLYRIPGNSDEAEPAPEAGEKFVASSLRASPKGDKLAIIGRRNLGSGTELYVLDPETGDFRSATSNEDMEIKTGPYDLSWSPDGSSVAILARGVLSAPEARPAPAHALTVDFYNVYEVPVR